nr:hypothetical protein [Streptomyces sp. CC224B]
MMATFEALDELFDDSLTLPIKGKTYRIPSPSGEDGLRVQRITTTAARLIAGGEALDAEQLDDAEERDLLEMCLGPVYEQLLADGVDWAWIRHAGLTAMFWIIADVEQAQAYWRAAGDPSRRAPNRETRRATAKATKGGSGAAKSTPRRGSTSGTSVRPATSRARKASKD